MSDALLDRGELYKLQSGIATDMQAHPFFADVMVLYERVEDLDAKVQEALVGKAEAGGKAGVGCIVLTPSASVKSADAPGPTCDPVVVLVRVIEYLVVNVGPNGTKKPASLVAEVAASFLHQRRIADFGACLYVVRFGLSSAAQKKGHIVYDVVAHTQMTLEGKEVQNGN